MLIANASEPVRRITPAPPAISAPRITTDSIGRCPSPGSCNGAPYTTYYSDASCTSPMYSEYLVAGIDRPYQPAKLNVCYSRSQEHYSDKNLRYTCSTAFTSSYYASGCDSSAPLASNSVPIGICMASPYGGAARMHFCN
jgi:hypothetical protein